MLANTKNSHKITSVSGAILLAKLATYVKSFYRSISFNVTQKIHSTSAQLFFKFTFRDASRLFQKFEEIFYKRGQVGLGTLQAGGWGRSRRKLALFQKKHYILYIRNAI